MGDLRDQLKKAGLISAKQAKKLAREESAREHRRRKAEKSGDEEALAALETDADRARRELQEAEAERRRQQAEQVEAERADREEREHWERVHEILDSNRVRPGRGEAWRFVASDGHIQELEVCAEVAEDLRQGELAVVERAPRCAPEDAHRFVLLPAEAALRVEALDPYAIRFLNRPGREAALVLESGEAAPEPGADDLAGGGEEDDFLAGLPD